MLTIGEFSGISRVSVKTLRYYDHIGLFKPGRVNGENGYRYYEVAQLREILLISRLKLYRFSLPEIAAILVKNDAAYLAASIRGKQKEIAREIGEQQSVLRAMKQDIEKIERCGTFMNEAYTVKTVTMQPKTIYTLRRKMGIKDIGRAFGDLCVGIGRHGLKPCGPFLSIYHDEEFDRECSDIEVGVVVDTGSGEHVRTFAPELCCFATHIGPYDDFSQCYTALAEWIEGEGYTVSGPPFELYIRGCEDNVPPSAYVTEIYFPITK